MTSRSGSDHTGGPGTGVSILVLSVGILLGLLMGAGVYLVLHPQADAGVLVFASLDPGALAYPVAGGLVGILLSYAMLGIAWVRAAGRIVIGLYGGAIAGLLVYTLGFVAAHHQIASGPQGYLALAAVGVVSVSIWQLMIMGLGAVTGVLLLRYYWRFEGLLAFVALASVVAGYIGYSLVVTLPQVPSSALPLSILLFVCETMALSFVLIYAFYPLDVIQRKRWSRLEDQREFSPYYEPKVAFQVPIFNEPPAMVEETLDALRAIDYPEDRYEIMVLDDSTDPEAREPIRRYCEDHGLTYLHREDRHGYKAGALNDALPHTPPDVELLAVIDADYQVEPDYLRNTVGYFVDPDVAFLQTPQNYRNAEVSFLTKQYMYADAYFYHTVLPSRNEANAIIFCGTMGILRRRALKKVGGWSEEHVTEDAELAARILEAGYDTVYVSQEYGHGLIPETFAAFKKQHNRWAFGGGQVLATHAKDVVTSKELSRRQKFDYIAGIAHWYDGVFLVAIGLILLALGLGDLAGTEVVTHHQAEVWLVGLIPLFLVAEALVRVRVSLNRVFDLSFTDTLSVFGMWFASKFSNTWAALRGTAGEKMPFVRTPKGGEDSLSRWGALRKAVGLAPFETAMASSLSIVALGIGARSLTAWNATGSLEATRLFFIAWLAIYALVFLCAPLYAYRSYRDLAKNAQAEAAEAEASQAGAQPDHDAPGIGQDPPEDPSPWARDPWRKIALVSIVLLALALRFKDPVTHLVIGAEDPYIHMERTWDLIQHQQLPDHYPPGFALLLAPLALLGPDAFYWSARMVPPLLGAIQVTGVYLLIRHSMRETAALGGALAVAVMPENIFRTNLLFPTAVDLAVLPFLFLLLLRGIQGHRRAWYKAAFLGGVLVFIHPWIAGLALPPLVLWGLLNTSQENRTRLVLGAGVAGVALLVLLSNLPGTWNPVPQMMANVGATLDRIAADPTSLAELPRFVNLAGMLTPAVLIVGGLGLIAALTRRTPLDQLAVIWTLLLLPLALVDWFDIWFLPHRVVAFLTLGVGLLVAVAVDRGYDVLSARPKVRTVRTGALAAAGMAFLLVTVPAGAATQDWYRLYDEDDYAVWGEVADGDPPLVIAGSWQTRAGYRALTGQSATYHVSFFEDPGVRDQVLDRQPGLVVITSAYAEENGHPTGFLETGNWTRVAGQGDVQAYQHTR